MCLLDKDLSCGFYFEGQNGDRKCISCPPPSFGKPYSDKFNKIEPDKVVSYNEGSAKVIKAEYHFQEFSGLSVMTFYKIYPDGILEKWLQILNNRESEIIEDFSYCDRFDIYEDNLTLPYKNKIIRVQDGIDDDMDFYDFSQITENWLFVEHDKGSAGLTWPKEYQLKYIEDSYAFEHNLKG